jgi:hypothetical protein
MLCLLQKEKATTKNNKEERHEACVRKFED